MTTVATSLLRVWRAFLMALRVFLVNFTLTVLAFPGWRVREAFLPLNLSERTICACRFLLEERAFLIVAATLILQRWPARSLSLRLFCFSRRCFFVALTTRPQAAWRAPSTSWLPWSCAGPLSPVPLPLLPVPLVVGAAALPEVSDPEPLPWSPEPLSFGTMGSLSLIVTV